MDHPVGVADRSEPRDPRIVDGPAPRPPDPPLQDKRWLFYRYQIVGIPLMLLIVLAAAFGVFGTTRAAVSVGNDAVQLTVGHVSRFRYKMIGPVEITVENRTGELLTDVTLRIERRYLDRFSNVVFTPGPTSLDSEWMVFDLGEVEAERSIVVSGEIQSESFGSHDGVIRVTAEGIDSVEAPISTFSFP